MTTDQTEAATRARIAERTAFARGARMGSEAEAAAPPPPKQPPTIAVGGMANDGFTPITFSGPGSWAFTYTDTMNLPLPPPPPHVERPLPSLNPFPALGRLISGVNVPPAVAGVTRALLEAAAVGALSKAASLLAVAHVPVEYAALAAAGVMVLRATEGIVDQWGKGGADITSAKPQESMRPEGWPPPSPDKLSHDIEKRK